MTTEEALAATRAELDAALAKLAKVSDERDQYQRLYELASLELARIRRQLFGQKAETVDPRQIQLAFENGFDDIDPALASMVKDMVAEEVAAHEQRARKSRKPTGRKPLPDTLPVERIHLPPPVNTEGLIHIGDEVSETLEWRPASPVRVQVVRGKYVNPQNETQGVVMAEVPEKPIPRSKAGPGMLAHVITSKYGDHIPLHRQEKILSRYGIDLSRSTMSGWMKPCAALLRHITDAMMAEALATARWIGIDATGVLVQAKHACKRGHFWVMVAERDHVLFRYTERHTGAAAHSLLEGYEGTVIADAAAVYHQLYREESVTEAGCWSHNRRYFFEAIVSEPDKALVALTFIKKLFRAEHELREKKLPPSKRLGERRSRAGPIVDDFFEWVSHEHKTALPRSPFGKALQYALNQEQPLRRFLDDPHLRMDNNLSELELRRQVVGRKNWLFCGSDEAAEWNTVFVSLIASCELHGIEPWAYLRDVLTLLPHWKKSKALELAPKYWKATSAREATRALLERDVFWRVSAGKEGHSSPDTTSTSD